MLIVIFLFLVAFITCGLGIVGILMDLKEDYTPVEDWFWAVQVKEQFYIPTEMEGWPSSEEMEPEFVIVSEEGLVWSGKTLDLRDWEQLKFELEVELSSTVKWIETKDADPKDDGLVLVHKNRTFVPELTATVQYEESDPMLAPMPMNPIVLQWLRDHDRYPKSFESGGDNTVSY
jgi:hypothetical protein